MNRRFDGAISTPDDETVDSTDLPEPARPSRPLSVEVCAAILIVGGITDILGTLAWASGVSAGSGVTAATEPNGTVVALLLALNVLTVVVGVLMRAGRAWRVCINVAAVLVFVELMAVVDGSAVALLLAVLDGFVFVTLTRQRAWFDWRPPAATPDDRHAAP